MAPKKGAAKPKEVAAAEANIADEWVKSKTGTAEIKKLVAAGVLPDQATAGWRPAVGEFFPTPNTDEAVVFEDYFWRGLGFPVHPFLRNLLELWGISLCNLHPNTVLHIAIFINFCEAYLGILPHFNLFRHLFCLKKRGGPGSKVVGGVYLQLRDGMANEYLSVPLNTSLKGWNSRWFYMKQIQDCSVRCDVYHVPEVQKSWSEKPIGADMTQVTELLELIKGCDIDGPLVACNFIMRRVQPCKERAHPGFAFEGKRDGTREMDKDLGHNEILNRALELFSNPSFKGKQKTFSWLNPPPAVTVLTSLIIL